MDKNIITFNSILKRYILDIFNKDVDDRGMVVEKNNPLKKVFTPDGEELEISQFAGIKKGSEIYLKSDIFSLINLYDSIK